MRFQRLHIRWLVVAGVAALVAVAIVPTAAARSTSTTAPTIEPDGWAYQYAGPGSPYAADGWADQIVDPYGTLALRELEQKGLAGETFVPGVTDSTTGVMRELERKGVAGEAFIPGVTDSTTGVARDLERRGLEPRAVTPVTSVGDSGFHWDDAAIGMGAALAAAALAAACGALVFGERRRRRLAI